MSRTIRGAVFSPDEIAIAHVWNRVVRRCFLLGEDEVSGENYSHRKQWILNMLDHYAMFFGIDLIEFSLLDNHFHFILRSRPDVVETWTDREVAWRWLMICPKRKRPDGTPEEPSEPELNAIENDPEELADLRCRLSDFSWWMRLICQRVAQKANAEDGAEGKFWETRFKATRICDEASLLACAAYVNLNPVRAALAELLELGEFTSIQRRIQARQLEVVADNSGSILDASQRPDRHLAPLTIDEANDPLGPHPSKTTFRCSDKGYLAMPLDDFIQLLDWTARQRVESKRGATPESAPPILDRLNISPEVWCGLVAGFPKLFFNVAGLPETIAEQRHRCSEKPFHCTRRQVELMA